MRGTFPRIVYSLSTELSVYNPTEDASRLTLHILCVVCIEVLCDCCIRMTETGGDVNGFRPCFDETCCMGMTKTVWVEVKLTQTSLDTLMPVWYPVWQNTEQMAADIALWRRYLFGEYDTDVILSRTVDKFLTRKRMLKKSQQWSHRTVDVSPSEEAHRLMNKFYGCSNSS